MEYVRYAFRKNIENAKKSNTLEAKQYLRPLEEMCREAGGIVIDDRVIEMHTLDQYNHIQTWLVDNVVVKHSVYIHNEIHLQSSVETRVICRHHGDNSPFVDKIQDYYQTRPAVACEDSHKKLAGNYLVPQNELGRKS